MISSLLFLMIVLLLASATPHEISHSSFTPASGFILSLVYFFITLVVIAIQNRVRPKLVLANVELITALALFQFYFHGYAFFAQGPALIASSTFLTLFLLTLYFLGLFLTWKSNATSHLRLLLPFSIPFLIFCLITDLSSLLPPLPLIQQQGPFGQVILVLFATFAFFGLVLALIPPIAIRLWQCKPIDDEELRQRLDKLCQRIHFHHGGILIWNVMQNAITAAIIGIFPRYRYVIFTQGLLDKLAPSSVEAVLAHEIGHNRHKHLLLYPLIIFGLLPILGLFDALISPLIELQEWNPLVIFVLATGILLLYFRFVFGYFSRLFERQADLFVFEAGVDPEQMISALDSVAIHSGYIHNDPSWHHHSIQERINLLREAQQDPTIIAKHRRSIRVALLLYVLLLLGGISGLVVIPWV